MLGENLMDGWAKRKRTKEKTGSDFFVLISWQIKSEPCTDSLLLIIISDSTYPFFSLNFFSVSFAFSKSRITPLMQ